MRLPRLWAVMRRRWPVLVLVPLLALGLAAYNYKAATRVYTASGELTITDSSPYPGDPQYAQYYRDLSSEAATDDFLRIVPGSRFAQDVAKQLPPDGTIRTPDDVQKALTAARVYRVLTVKTTAKTSNDALAVEHAALETLAANAGAYLPGRPVQATVIDTPNTAKTSSLKAGVLAVGTLLAAILAAAVIALLVDVFDNRLHDGRDVEELLGVPVVGTVPGRTTRAGRAA